MLVILSVDSVSGGWCGRGRETAACKISTLLVMLPSIFFYSYVRFSVKTLVGNVSLHIFFIPLLGSR